MNRHRPLGTLKLWLLAAGLTLPMAGGASALTIVPYFDSSITGAANAGEIEGTINNALKFYNNFSNAGYVYVAFGFGAPRGALGHSVVYEYADQYSDYVATLAADAAANPRNTVLATAVANLPKGNIPPLESNYGLYDRFIIEPSAFWDVQGYPLSGGQQWPDLPPAPYDGRVFLDQSLLSFSDTVGSGQYNATQVVQHEVNEILGIGGIGSALDRPPDPFNGQAMFPLDLYRYSAPGVPSYTTDPNAVAYFSIDGGVTDIMNFNQHSPEDFGDWARSGCQAPFYVQDAGGCPGGVQFGMTRSSPEVVALQAIGYNLWGVPEPGAWSTLLLGLGMLGLGLRTRRRAQAV